MIESSMQKITELSVFLFFIGIFVGNAQSVKISGIVTRYSDDEPLFGANVMIRGTQTGVATDKQGNYALIASENDVLIFSFIGMKTQFIPVKDRTFLRVRLEPENIAVAEALVVAFGSVSPETYSGAASFIGHKDIETRPLTNILQVLDGNICGLEATSASGQPGSSPDFRIRGFGSVNASASPLIVVDGVPYAGNIADIHPNDVESISVLKDASSSALYGSRGGNGVILITTHRGSQKACTYKVSVDQGFSTRAIPEYDRVNTDEYYPLMWEAYRNSLMNRKTNPLSREEASQVATLGSGKTENIAQLLRNNPFGVADTEIVGTDGKLNPAAHLLYPDDLDWEDAVSQIGYRSDYTISADGGSETVSYYLSMGYAKENSYIINSDYERMTARANISVVPKHWLSAGVNISGAVSNASVLNVENNTNAINPFYFTRNIGPIYPVHRHAADGGYIYDKRGEAEYEQANRPEGAFPERHIVAELDMNSLRHEQNSMNSRIFASLHPLKGLTFTVNAAYDLSNNLISEYENAKIGSAAGNGRAKRTDNKYNISNFNELLRYQYTSVRHSFDILAGHESFSNTKKFLFGYRSGQFIDGNDELDNFTTITDLSSHTDKYRAEGYFFHFDYNYSERYIVSASYRRDASSRFHENSRWGNFWSVGAAWIITREKFMNATPFVGFLKLRTSYGKTGNDNTESWYPWKSSYAISNNGQEAGLIQNTTAGNRKLKWESNAHFDVSLEFRLFGRLRGNIEYYNRVTDDLLFSVPQPLSGGVLTQWQNTGSMSNKGIEFNIEGNPVSAGDFKWTIGFVLSHFKNEITSLPQKEISAGNHKRMVGQSIYDFFLPDFAGVDPENGDALYRMDIKDAEENITGETTTNDINKASRYYCGTALPKLTGSIYNTVNYKGVEFMFRFGYRLGGKTYDDAYANLMHSGTYGKAMHKDVLNRWQNGGDLTDVPRLEGDNPHLSAPGSRWLTNASYLSLKSVGLSYRFPRNIPDFLNLQHIRVYAAGENLFILTHRKGMNPQNSFLGISANDYTPARICSMGIEVSF